MSEVILSELQLLVAMFDPLQIHFDDPEVVLMVENAVNIPGSVSLSVKLNEHLNLFLRLPEGYPASERLSASCQIVRSGGNKITQSWNEFETRLNSDLNTWIKREDDKVPPEERNILGVINWVNDKWEQEWGKLRKQSEHEKHKPLPHPDHNHCRIWIHSHHIYSEKKRKFLLETAHALDLTGFCLPGKPGFICVEGDAKGCDTFWAQTRQLTWQKISLIERQIIKDEERVFQNFQELSADKSSFMKFLKDKGVSTVIKDYLGF